MATRLQINYRLMMKRSGNTVAVRNMRTVRNSAVIKTLVTKEMIEKRAGSVIAHFLEASSWRKKLAAKMIAMNNFVYHWFCKAKKVRNMVLTRREFLTQIFNREHRIMLDFYRGKKKHKKLYQKLEKIKDYNLLKILDDYFYGVCYEFYKR